MSSPRERRADVDSLRPERVLPLLRGRFGRPYLHRCSCTSTQELVRGLAEGAVACCEHQTAGRGRMGRPWLAPPGTALLFSLSLCPRTPPERLAPLSLVLAEAVCEAVWPEAAVRWPNDVVVGGRKLAGVLPELRDGQLVAGVGVNANLDAGELPPQARVPATSLLLLRGEPCDRAELLADLLAAIERRYRAFEERGFAGLERDELRGRIVALAGGERGLCEGVDAAGRLVVGGRAHVQAEVRRVDVEPEAAPG